MIKVEKQVTVTINEQDAQALRNACMRALVYQSPKITKPKSHRRREL